jgi:hypothetical protein
MCKKAQNKKANPAAAFAAKDSLNHRRIDKRNLGRQQLCR